jgi:type IX secretion system PorP/SprF family membrane protein
MKKLLTILIAFAATTQLNAQQRPHYTQYILNNYILNPALTGIENYIDVKISARDQWLGLDGAPRTAYISAHGPIGKKDLKTTATSFNIPGENPRGNSYWENYTASESHHGAGVMMVSDKTGLYNRFSANLSYAYHMGLSPKTNLSAGFAAGIQKVSYDRSKATPVDPSDPSIGSSSVMLSKIRPDLSAGLWLYGSDYFAGASVQQALPQKVAFVDDTLGFRLTPHYFLTAGYRYLVNDDINILPSAMIKYGSGNGTQFDLNVKAQYRDLLWIGGSYRFQEGYAGMLGLNVGNTFNVGYSYDFTTSNLNTVSRGTHEIVIGFLIGNRYGDTCPRNVW